MPLDIPSVPASYPTRIATAADVGLASFVGLTTSSLPLSTATIAALALKRDSATPINLDNLAQNGATTGQVIKWDGAKWAPGTDIVGSGGGGGGAVSTVFGRVGDVVPQSNDYTFAQIGSKPTTLSGYGITDATPSSHVGSNGAAHADATTSLSGFMSASDKVKLTGVAAGATANSPDATLLDRNNHTGTQAISTITSLQANLDLKANANNPAFTGTATGLSKSMVGLAAVDNTADSAKPVSTAQAAAIALKNDNIQFQNQGTNLGAAGTASTFNVTGASATLSRSGNVITLAVATPTETVESIATGAPYTLVAGDAGKIKRGVDSAAQTINITTAFNGLSVTIQWPAAAGTITLDANAGVNLNNLGDGVNIVLSQAAGAVRLIPTGTNTWDVVGAIGDLVAADVTDSTTAGRAFLTAADVAAQTALLNNFTSSLKGLAPPSGGGTANYLRADGTWAAPPGSGGVTDGDKGDITTSSGGTVWTIDPAAVTLAKMANLAQDQVIGRVTASTGVPETFTVTAAARTVLDDTTTSAMRTTLGVAIGSDVDAFASTVSQAEAEAGTSTTVRNWTAERVKQAAQAAVTGASFNGRSEMLPGYTMRPGTNVPMWSDGAPFAPGGVATAESGAWATSLYLPRNHYEAASAGTDTPYGIAPDGAGHFMLPGTDLRNPILVIENVWGPDTAVTTTRFFIGVSTPGGSFNGEPSAMTNLVGFAADGGSTPDSNVQVMHNDGSGACTKINLGSNFPAKSANADAYLSRLAFYPTGSAMNCDYYIKNLITNQAASGTITTNMPEIGTASGHRTQGNTGTTSVVGGLKLHSARAWQRHLSVG